MERKKDLWQTILDEYAADPSVDGLLLVKCMEHSLAEVDFCCRDAQGVFVVESRGMAFIGKNGLGKQREGDAMTPEGDFGIRRAFGILPNPGTSMEYLPITHTTIACDSPGAYYNQIVEEPAQSVAEGACPELVEGERMMDYPSEYSYGLELDYNPGNVYPRGSAIFVHCKGAKPYTMGCVALDEEFMRHILVKASPRLKVCIHRMDGNSK